MGMSKKDSSFSLGSAHAASVGLLTGPRIVCTRASTRGRWIELAHRLPGTARPTGDRVAFFQHVGDDDAVTFLAEPPGRRRPMPDAAPQMMATFLAKRMFVRVLVFD
jgi:hypothetical protein